MKVSFRRKPRVREIVLEKLPPDVVHYLRRKAINSDGARALLTKYHEKLPENLGRRVEGADARVRELGLAIEPCPKCGTSATRETRRSRHGKPVWACDRPDCLVLFVPTTGELVSV